MTIKRVHGNTTYEWHTDDIRVHASDVRMTYGWHTSTYEWHTDDIRVHPTYQWHTSDIRMTYEYIRVTYSDIRVHTNDMWVHTSDIRMTYEWHADDMWFKRKLILKLIFLKLFNNSLSIYLICKRIPWRLFAWVIYQN